MERVAHHKKTIVQNVITPGWHLEGIIRFRYFWLGRCDENVPLLTTSQALAGRLRLNSSCGLESITSDFFRSGVGCLCTCARYLVSQERLDRLCSTMVCA